MNNQTSSKNITSFGREVLSRLKNNNESTLVERIERKSRAAHQQQIAALENKIVDEEDAVSEGQVLLKDTIFPITITNDPNWGKEYVANINRIRIQVKTAEDTLAQTQEALNFFKNLIESFN